MITKACIECGQTFYGRSDKKFCDDYCRNLHNNKLNSDTINYMRNINNTLRRNRHILAQLLASATVKTVSRRALSDAGFSFLHYTSVYVKKSGVTIFHCYDYQYLPCHEKCTLTKIKKLQPK